MKITLYMDCYGSGHGIVSGEWEFLPGKTSYRTDWMPWTIYPPPTLEQVLAEGRWAKTKAEAVARYRAHAERELERAQSALATI